MKGPPRDFLANPILSRGDLAATLDVPLEILDSLANSAGNHYKPFKKLKPNGTHRVIDNPRKEIKAVQSRILRRILELVPNTAGMGGGLRGVSTADVASKHKNQPVVVSLDLRNCFGTITHKHVHDLFKNRLHFGRDVASPLTRLTTYHRHLPQGAPTSPKLCALVLDPMFVELRHLADEFGLEVTMWVDDITFSGRQARAAIQPAIKIISSYGLSVRNKKVQVTPRHRGGQLVLGINVNHGCHVPRAYVESVRSDLLRLKSAGDPRLASSIEGRILYIETIEGWNSARVRSLHRLADKCCTAP